jgi:hypothetical protein
MCWTNLERKAKYSSSGNIQTSLLRHAFNGKYKMMGRNTPEKSIVCYSNQQKTDKIRNIF